MQGKPKMPVINSESSSDKKIMKSCEDKFNQQPMNFDDEPKQNPQSARAARSYNSDDGEGWESVTEENQKELTKNWGSKFKEDEKASAPKISNKKEQFRKFVGEDGKFTSQIIQSESVSLHQSVRSEFNPDQPKVEEPQFIEKPKTPKYFNIMLVGGGSTGKTTYINCFLRQYKQNQLQREILDPTTQIKQYELSPRLNHLNLQTKIIDTPGFKASTFPKYVETICQQIETRSQNYKEEYNKTMRVSSIYTREDRVAKDCRIHCCLLFFRGPRIHTDDWQLLKVLQNLTNVIPIIAKGDCYTILQVKQLKNNIIQRARKQMVNWFDALEYVRQKYPQILPQLQQGPYGRSPPFMIVGSNSQIDKNGHLKLSRQYRWGTCYIQNESHTQFNLLNRLLIDYFRDGLVKLIQIKERRHQDEQVDIRANEKNKYSTMLWITVTACVSALVYIKFKGENILNK